MRVGEALAEARGRAGLTVAEVSQRTRIREAIITAIEHEDFSACGGDFYARGDIRSIAMAVGADPEPLIREYDVAHRAPGVLSAVSLDELVAQGQAPERRWNWTAVLGVALIAALGLLGYTFLAGPPHTAHRPPAAASGPLAAASHAATSAGLNSRPPTGLREGAAAPHLTAPAHRRTRPTATVRAYIAAINGHHYARAWRLGGRNVGGASYPGFVSGFTGTAKDTLTILSVSGHVVTARLNARQTNGTVNTYQGTYTVHHNVITSFDVIQLS